MTGRPPGLGYDLLARKRTGEQRLVEVKGLAGPLGPVWLEQNEWAQAQQRGTDYWLYVVAECATSPAVAVRAQDPASQVGGPRRIQRFQIRIDDLRRMAQEGPGMTAADVPETGPRPPVTGGISGTVAQSRGSERAG